MSHSCPAQVEMAGAETVGCGTVEACEDLLLRPPTAKVVEVTGDKVAYHMSLASPKRWTPGQQKGAKFPTSKAPLSAVFHSFRLIFGRAIISRNGLEAWMWFP